MTRGAGAVLTADVDKQRIPGRGDGNDRSGNGGWGGTGSGKVESGTLKQFYQLELTEELQCHVHHGPKACMNHTQHLSSQELRQDNCLNPAWASVRCCLKENLTYCIFEN